MCWRRAKYAAPAAPNWRTSWKRKAMPNSRPKRRPEMRADRHIMFDWNSTLLDDTDITHACTNRLLAMEGHKPVSIDVFRSCYHIPFDQFYRNLGLNETEIERLMKMENSAFHDL